MPEIIKLDPYRANPHIIPEQDGLYAGVIDAHYHGWSACSQSALKLFERSPAHLKAERDYPREISAQKQANLDLGSAFDMCTLQPDEFPKWFRLRPDGNANSNAFKDRVAAIRAENPFIRIISVEAWDKVHRMRDAVREHPVSGPLLGNSPQLSGVITHREHGVRAKFRLDDWAPGIGIVDLKKTGDARIDAFGRIAHEFRYVRQATSYLDWAGQAGINEDEFLFVVCEDERPHGVKVYRTQTSHIIAAGEELWYLMQRYAECERTNYWPNYSEDPDELVLPPWAVKAFEERTLELQEVA
jgi:hypothetical protein